MNEQSKTSLQSGASKTSLKSRASKISLQSSASYHPASLYNRVLDAAINALIPYPSDSVLRGQLQQQRRSHVPSSSSMPAMSVDSREPSIPLAPPSPAPPPRAVWTVSPPQDETRGDTSETLSTWTQRSAEFGLYATSESSRASSEQVTRQHFQDLIHVPATQVPEMYHQLCNAVWTAVRHESVEQKELEQHSPVAAAYANSRRMIRRRGSELYHNICDGVWEVLSLGSEPPGMESMLRMVEEGVEIPPRPDSKVKGEHVPDLICFPCDSLSSVVSSICDGVWEVVSLLSEEQEARLLQFDAHHCVGHHLPPLVDGPPETARTAPPRQCQATRGCYNVHPVVPKPLHSLLGIPSMRGAALAARGGFPGDRLVGLPSLYEMCAQRSASRPLKHWPRYDSQKTFLSRLEPPPLHSGAAEGKGISSSGSPARTESSDRERSDTGLSGLTCSEGAQMPYLYRDECVRRERLFWEMIMESLRLFRWPLYPPRRAELLAVVEKGGEDAKAAELELLQHPAMLEAQVFLSGVEHFERKSIAAEERLAMAAIEKMEGYERRVLTIGTLALEKFLRSWIYQFRGRKLLQAKQREHLCEREVIARGELLLTDPDLLQRFQLLQHSLFYFEATYRRELELLQLRTFYVTGNIGLRLSEQVCRFPILFGGSMRKTRACGRVSGNTVFMGAHLMEQMYRKKIEEVERFERYMELPWEARKYSLVNFFEPPRRRDIEMEEFRARVDLEYKLHQLIVHYRNRDVEIYRAATFDIEIERPFSALEKTVEDPFA